MSAGSDYDVVVVGGAFSGSATALLLKRQDPALRVLLVEMKPSFDRKVGESAIELSSWFLTRVLKLNRHLAIQQLPKYGLRFWFTNSEVTSLAEASELGNRYQTRVPSFHVDRAILDEHVLGLAAASGADLMRPARVLEADLEEGGRSTLRIASASGLADVTARWVIDATGRKAWLARKLGLYVPIREHPTHSVWARYRGVSDIDSGPLGPKPTSDTTVASRALSTNHLTGPGWWVWVIPLPGGDVSVGVVWDDRIFSLPRGDTAGQRFEKFLHSIPGGRELMGGAARVEDDLHALNGLPYRATKVIGDGWAMVGDAAGFIDPFYSPGLDWAALTAGRTADLVGRALKGETTREDIEHHDREFTVGFDRWVKALYIDKYYYMGDAELMEVALRMEVSLYYFGIVTPPYRGGLAELYVPFGNAVSVPFYHLVALVNRRLARLARIRMAAGTWGRRNAGRHVLLSGFKLGYSSLSWVPGALGRLLALEIGSIPDRIAARRSAREARQHGEEAMGAAASKPDPARAAESLVEGRR